MSTNIPNNFVISLKEPKTRKYLVPPTEWVDQFRESFKPAYRYENDEVNLNIKWGNYSTNMIFSKSSLCDFLATLLSSYNEVKVSFTQNFEIMSWLIVKT